MKKWMSVLVVSLMLASPAFAHCGKCGMGDDHAAPAATAEGAAGEAKCPMMKGEMAATIQEAVKALETSNPELSAKLAKAAENCCAKHEAEKAAA
jgi:hypothetical protein